MSLHPIPKRAAWAAAVLVAFVLAAAAPPALAGSLDDAKRNGSVGEQLDGYLGAIDPSAQGLVAKINAGRRAEYAKIAAKRGLTIDQVAAVAGEKLVRNAPAGQMVRGADGEWRKR